MLPIKWANRSMGVVVASLLVGSIGAQPPGPGEVKTITRVGPGGPMGGPGAGQPRKLVKQFDKDGDGKLNTPERQAAREFLKNSGRRGRPAPKPGPKVSPADVKNYPDAAFYDPAVLRTLFIDFESPDWEAEMAEFHNTDVEMPATLTVDGKKYPNVGVHFRGMSSFGGVGPGHKRSMGISLDHTDKKQRLYGYKTLNLLNSHDDPSHLNAVLYSHISRQYIPATKANLVRVVINGECWGIYPNVQQFNREFVEENFKTNKGARWKVPGPGPGGLVYVGDKIEDYKNRFDIKSADKKESWQALIKLCKTLHETPPEKLEAALRPIVDIDSLLWFLALDVALINGDGYWTRNSDYNLYLDEHGKFHFLPHDINEAFKPTMSPMGPPMAQRPSPPGDVLPAFARDSLKLTDEQKQKVAALQKDVEAKLDALFTEEQKKNWKEIRNRPQPRGGMMMGGPGGGIMQIEVPGQPVGPPPGGPPAARGPGGPPPGAPPMLVPAGTAWAPGVDFVFAGGRGTNVELDPLVGLDDPQKPLRSKVLAVPSFRAQYLKNIRTIADESLDWKKLGPVVAQLRSLIEQDVERDTRRLYTFEAFKNTTADDPATGAGGSEFPLRAFADQRRKFLLSHPEVKKIMEAMQRGE